jgi:hypothetical protein
MGQNFSSHVKLPEGIPSSHPLPTSPAPGSALGGLLGLAVGGSLVTSAGWRSAFLLLGAPQVRFFSHGVEHGKMWGVHGRVRGIYIYNYIYIRIYNYTYIYIIYIIYI